MIKIADEIELDNFISSDQFGVVSFVNPHSLYNASIDDRFRCALENNVMNCLDGVGASLTYRYFAGSGKRITGRMAYKKCVKFALETEMSLMFIVWRRIRTMTLLFGFVGDTWKTLVFSNMLENIENITNTVRNIRESPGQL